MPPLAKIVLEMLVAKEVDLIALFISVLKLALLVSSFLGKVT